MPKESDLHRIVGKRIVSATSSLKNFSIELESDLGLRIDALDGPKVGVEIVAKSELPIQTEAVCSVDWNWIYHSSVKNVVISNNILKLELDPAGPITVTAANWQGSAFLGFQPYKPAK